MGFGFGLVGKTFAVWQLVRKFHKWLGVGELCPRWNKIPGFRLISTPSMMLQSHRFANAIIVLKIHLAGNRVLYLFASMDFLHDEDFDELVLEQHFTQSLGMSDID